MFEGSSESQYSYYDILFHPFVRDMDVILSAVVGYFIVQFATQFLMPYFSQGFRKLSLADQRSFAIRVVSIVNGIVMFQSAFVFVDQLRVNGWRLGKDHYTEVPGYRPFRLIIVGYFLWDLIVCVAYNWGAMWTIHAIASFLGTYFLAFPFSDQYGAYYSGMFETSNGFLHIAHLCKMLNVHLGFASTMEYIFAFLFFAIRVVGGTIVTSSWYMDMIPMLMAGKGHSHVTIISCLVLVFVVMILQYVWFWEIVKLALGLKPREEASSSKAQQGESSPPAKDTVKRRRPAPKTE